MRLCRGRAGTIEADRAVSDRLVERVADEREPAVRVWTPHRQLAFGRRDANEDGYERAREAAADRGFPPVEREVGGRAVAYTGSTVAFARLTPVEDPRSGLDERYDAALADLRAAVADLGVTAGEGEPPESFCPGSHSLQTAAPDGRARKLAGLAQRVRRRVAVVAGVLLVDGHEAVADVLGAVYPALGVAFDPGTVGSLARAGGESDPTAAVEAVADALAGDAAVETERVGEARGLRET